MSPRCGLGVAVCLAACTLAAAAVAPASAIRSAEQRPTPARTGEPVRAHLRAPLTAKRTVRVGHSADGRAIEARRLGRPSARRKVLVVGVIHGNEAAGLRVIHRLRRRRAQPHGVDLWTIEAVNPDGLARDTRQNARGVDLNRNFSYRWSGAEPAGSGDYAGPHPFSEPESRAVRRLIRRIHPRVTIWYHQPWGQVLAPCHGRIDVEHRYARISGIALKRCRGQHLPGTATSWQRHRLPHTHPFVVELPAGSPSRAMVRRNARAVARIAVGKRR